MSYKEYLSLNWVLEFWCWNDKLNGIMYKKDSKGKYSSLLYLRESNLEDIKNYTSLYEYLLKNRKFARVMVIKNKGLYDIALYNISFNGNYNDSDYLEEICRVVFKNLNDSFNEIDRIVSCGNVKKRKYTLD